MTALRGFGSTSSGGSVNIPEYSADPLAPSGEDAWVLHYVEGTPIGLLLSLTQDLPTRHFFSYRTLENTTVRVELFSNLI